MATELLYVVASMVLLGIVTVGVARVELGAPSVVCWTLFLPVVAIGSVVALWLRAALHLDLLAVPAGVGVVVLVIGFATAATD